MHKKTRYNLCHLLDESVDLFRKYWASLFVLPFVASLLGFVHQLYVDSRAEDQAGFGDVVLLLLLFAVTMTTYAGLILQIKSIKQNDIGMSPGNAFLMGFGKLPKLLLAQLLTIIILLLFGSVPFLLVVLLPGLPPLLLGLLGALGAIIFIVMLMRLSVYPMVILIDKLGIRAGLVKSFQLTRGISALVIIFVIYSVLPLVGLLLIVLPNILFGFFGYFLSAVVGIDFSEHMLLVESAYSLAFITTNALITPLMACGMLNVFEYLSERYSASQVLLEA